MAPGSTFEANLPATTLVQKDNTPPTLYQSEEQDALIKKSQNHLLGFGSAIHDEIVTGTAGLYFYTASGQRLLDWTSGQMSCLLGHGHPEIVKVIVDHAMYLDHTFSGMVSPPVIHLAERLCRMLPKGLDRAMFLSTGGESNEAAIKLAKVCTGKFEVVGLGASWHGVTAQAVGAQFHFGRSGHGPLMPGSMMLPAPNGYRSVFRNAADGSYDWEAELDYGWRMIDLQSCGSLACCIVECIQSSGGMHVLPRGYLKALKRHCEKRGMLLIVDEAQTGVGRCGDFMAIDHEQVVPDILTLSKTLGNGLPLSAVVTSEHLHRVSQAQNNFFFYTTHLNDPLVAAVGDKVLEIVHRDDLVQHAREVGSVLHRGLRTLMARYGCIGEVRGRGLMAGVEIVTDRESKTPGNDLAKRIGDRAFEHGLWANLSSHPSFGGVFRIAPPITVTAEQIEQGLEILERAFAETEGSLPLYAN
ncbi:aminotransferase, class III [Beauveria bassiana ARSEF 2860]|uniref:Aminotransferase, class III n=1 Tax=Beauveria bassiana (strain ARSEF 2860) TaxID=655819 RepID=J5K232_BEAB2|nr:aminotransferase, class III [Beauveria bassiana ARSEF 2860]EJP68206.1 aminotransferase, class III [Beauveria bassiana ARSEF 2860]